MQSLLIVLPLTFLQKNEGQTNEETDQESKGKVGTVEPAV
jgi:hypothetical protein